MPKIGPEVKKQIRLVEHSKESPRPFNSQARVTFSPRDNTDLGLYITHGRTFKSPLR